MYIVGCCDQIISNRQYIKHMFWSPECLEPSPSTTGGVWWAALLSSFAFTQIGARSCYLHRGHHLTKGWHCFCCRNLVGPTCRDPHQIAKKIWHLNNLLQLKPGHASYALDGRELSGTWRKKWSFINPLGMRKEKWFDRAKHLRNPIGMSPPPGIPV